jgi:hypothetical protein
MKIKDRFKRESPSLFKRITNAFLIIGAVGGALLAAPVALPGAVLTAAGYMVTAGVIGGTVSKLTVSEIDKKEE